MKYNYLGMKALVVGFNSYKGDDAIATKTTAFTDLDFGEMMANGLRPYFERVFHFNLSQCLMDEGMGKLNTKLIEVAIAEEVDFVFITMISVFITRKTVQTLRKLGIKVVGYFFDDETQFEIFSKYWISDLDYIVTVDSPDSKKKYEKEGHLVAYWPVGVEHLPYKKEPNKKYDVSFVGQKYLEREQLISYVNKVLGIDIKVAGRGWNAKSPVTTEEMKDIFVQSKINLSFSRTFSGRTQLKGRIFEVTGAGGFLITEYAKNIEDYFNLGSEIVCFRTKEDLVSEINYYLKNDEEREKIAYAGWKKTMSCYTWDKHFENVLRQINDIATLLPKIQTKNNKKSDGYIKNFETRNLICAATLFIDRKPFYTDHFEAIENEGCETTRTKIVKSVLAHKPRMAGVIMIKIVHIVYKYKAKKRMLRKVKINKSEEGIQ